MAHDLTETTVIHVVDQIVDKMRKQHVCVHEGDIAVLLESSRRADRIHEEIGERHLELQKIVSANSQQAAANEKVVGQLGKTVQEMQKLVADNTIDIATNRAEKRTALVVAALVSGFIGSLGGIVAVLTFLRGFMPHMQ